MMTREEAATRLDGNEYLNEGTKDLFSEMRTAGLVAVYGAGDDNMVFNGAIHDEVGCYNGGRAYLTASGLLKNDCDEADCPYHKRLIQQAATIKAVWGDEGFSWTYRTAIPHSTFVIKEDGSDYCRGIVFALSDVTPS